MSENLEDILNEISSDSQKDSEDQNLSDDDL